MVHPTARPVERIIPARAGFTCALRARARARVDHPRSRGVYDTGLTGTVRRAGLSPLARGLPVGPFPLAVQTGIIPARAGFTQANGEGILGWRDHPRSRGVYVCITCARVRVWIIPARAGFTIPASPVPSVGPDHPRSRGVYRCAVQRTKRFSGSSPLARGLPSMICGASTLRGIIPARAGFTRPQGEALTPVADHPRSRGVYSHQR